MSPLVGSLTPLLFAAGLDALAAPPPPPAPSRSAVVAEPRSDASSPIVLTNGDDSVFVSRRLTRDHSGPMTTPLREGSYLLLELADGRSLRVSDTTRSGLYPLADGDTLDLFSEPGGPRRYRIRRRGFPCFRFVVHSSRGIALLVQRGTSTPADSASIASLTGNPSVLRRASSPAHLDFSQREQLVVLPRSWYGSGEIRVPEEGEGLTVTFLVYAAPSPMRDRLSDRLVRHIGPVRVPRYGPDRPLPEEETRLERPSLEVLSRACPIGESVRLPAASPESAGRVESRLAREPGDSEGTPR